MAKGIRWSSGPTAFHMAADHLWHSSVTSVGQTSPGLLLSPKINSMIEKKTWVSTNSVLAFSFPLRFPGSTQLNLHWVLPPVRPWDTPVSCAMSEGTWLGQTTREAVAGFSTCTGIAETSNGGWTGDVGMEGFMVCSHTAPPRATLSPSVPGACPGLLAERQALLNFPFKVKAQMAAEG